MIKCKIYKTYIMIRFLKAILILFMFVTLSQTSFGQNTNVNPATVDVSKLSDAQIKKLVDEMNKKGLGIEEAIMMADHVVDIGPYAGIHGGEIIAQGTPEEVLANPASLTGQYLSGKKCIEIPKQRTKFNPERLLKIRGACGNNLQNVDIDIPVGLMTAITGVSGSGKSTLIKSLTGELELLNGKRVPGEHLAIGYFAQHQLESLDVSSTPFVHVQRLSPTASDQEIRNFLGGFGFKGDDAFGTVANYSGGEKARLALALVAWQKPNLLLLDEPTNHLDLEMREALTQALASFEGTVILVSHDRHLLRATVDEFWRVADHRVEHFDGDLEDYRVWLKARLEESRRDSRGEKAERQNQQPSGDSREARKASRKAAAELREKLRPLKKQCDQAEKAMEKAQQELDKVEQVLADPELYTDSSRKAELTKTLSQQAEIKARLDESERQWLNAEEALETMETELLASEETAS